MLACLGTPDLINRSVISVPWQTVYYENENAIPSLSPMKFSGVFYQCWTWSGFRIAIQTNSAIQNRIRNRTEFGKNPSDQKWIFNRRRLPQHLIRVFFGYKPDWIKLDSITG